MSSDNLNPNAPPPPPGIEMKADSPPPAPSAGTPMTPENWEFLLTIDSCFIGFVDRELVVHRRNPGAGHWELAGDQALFKFAPGETGLRAVPNLLYGMSEDEMLNIPAEQQESMLSVALAGMWKMNGLNNGRVLRVDTNETIGYVALGDGCCSETFSILSPQNQTIYDVRAASNGCCSQMTKTQTWEIIPGPSRDGGRMHLKDNSESWTSRMGATLDFPPDATPIERALLLTMISGYLAVRRMVNNMG